MDIKSFYYLLIRFLIINCIFGSSYFYFNLCYADYTGTIFDNIPTHVYRATPSKPADVFANGFQRSAFAHTDLSRHIQADTGDMSAFISTTSNYRYAEGFASSYAMGWWHVYEFYIYEIVPQGNFVSVRDTYLRTLNEETNAAVRENLENPFVRDTYMREDEYAALYEIPPERILSATRYEFDMTTRRYVRREQIENTVTRISRNNPAVSASLHPNTFSLGTHIRFQYNYNMVSSGFACYQQQTNTRQMKRANDVQISLVCPKINSLKFEKVPNPKSMLSDKSFAMNINIFLYKNFCLSPKGENYVYIDYCYNAQKWSYTEFGQFITEVHDGKNYQHYCLTSPGKSNDYNYVKMEICDLYNKDQLWKILKNDDETYSILTYNDKYLKSYYNYYVYTSFGFESYKTLKLKNAMEMQDNKSQALIQFSVNPFILNNHDILYPTSAGNVYLDDEDNVKNYQNFYNAHNNALFSSFGHDREGPQVCYYSLLIQNRGSTWDWIKDKYCSTRGLLTQDYRWFFQKAKNENKYHIVDSAGNILRIDDVGGSKNRYFAYNANPSWYDNNSFLDSFLLNNAALNFAQSFDNTKMESAEFHLNSYYIYNLIKEYFRRIHPIVY
ncbi:hypothetical protein [Silvanigrella aquatica]|uniref:Uncharacterized protein n=1 Tax=Silvanigrella aquatica TaxID=1915309 RepID=A0A1L4D2M3_9BACT|nr:hypothetical protein [Silvanigrella aquatica]APJ04444.1 hypothetical protein AXG55_11205 [Silvanigrella aquatica]